jgi:O-antigen/teichoic acid export membrane protein
MRLSPLGEERLIAHNLVLAGGTISAGLLGVAFQILMTHRLHPADYGSVLAVLSLLTLMGLPASALTLLMARERSRDQAQGRREKSDALLGLGNRWLLLLGVVLAGSVALGSGPLARYFNLPIELLLGASIGIPFALPLPLLMGELQGAQRFPALSLLVIGQATLKLGGALAFGSVWGAFGVLLGISAASALIYGVAILAVHPKAGVGLRRLDWPRLLAYLGIVLPSTLAIAVLFSADVLVVKHLFSARLAGQYAAVSAFAKAIFWAASGVAGVLFPKIVYRETRGRSGLPLVLASVLVTVVGGVVGLAILSIWASTMLGIFAGSAYTPGAAYLPLYTLGMTLLGAVVVLVATQQSRGNGRFLWVLLPAPILEAGLIFRFHSGLTQVVQAVDVSMAILLVGLAVLYVASERRATRAVGHEADDRELQSWVQPAIPVEAGMELTS